VVPSPGISLRLTSTLSCLLRGINSAPPPRKNKKKINEIKKQKIKIK
jgi:hypothetical protein